LSRSFSSGSLKSVTILLRTSRCVSDARVLLSDIECLGPDRAICRGCQSVSSWMKMTVDERVRGEKGISLLGRFESLHVALATVC